MMARRKELGLGGGRKPAAQASLLYGMLVGMTLGNLAAGAVLVGAGAAIGKAIVGKPLPRG